MTTYIFDTGILLGYIRGAGYAKYIEKKYSVSKPPNMALISMVSVGEILSLSIQFSWGSQRRQDLRELIGKVPSVEIGHPQILEKYAEIDAYSQGCHPSKRLPQGLSSRNMTKNDIWISATGSALNATLLTTDHDFDHLNGVFLKIVYIDQNLKGEDADAE